MVIFGQKSRIRKSVCIGAKWLHSSKIGCIQAKVFVFGQSGIFGKKWLYSGKMVLFE